MFWRWKSVYREKVMDRNIQIGARNAQVTTRCKIHVRGRKENKVKEKNKFSFKLSLSEQINLWDLFQCNVGCKMEQRMFLLISQKSGTFEEAYVKRYFTQNRPWLFWYKVFISYLEGNKSSHSQITRILLW